LPSLSLKHSNAVVLDNFATEWPAMDVWLLTLPPTITLGTVGIRTPLAYSNTGPAVNGATPLLPSVIN
jgi:hypothetical protein